MVGGGSKKKGKTQQNQQAQAANNKVSNTVAATAPAPSTPTIVNKESPSTPTIVNKESQQPLDAALVLDTAQTKTEDHSDTASPQDHDDDVTAGRQSVNATSSSNMEPPVVSADATTPSKGTWINKNLDEIPDFIPCSGGSLPSPAPLQPNNGLPTPLASSHLVQGGKASWNVSAPAFQPTGPAVVSQPTQIPPQVTPFIPNNVQYPQAPLMPMPNMYPAIQLQPSLTYPTTVYKLPNVPGQFYSYSQASGQKHIMSRPAEPAQGAYPLDGHGMALKPDTVNINLNDTRKKPAQPSYINSMPYSTPYMAPQYASQPQPLLTNNIVPIPMVQKPPVSREPVNVSAAALSEAPLPSRSIGHLPSVKEKPQRVIVEPAPQVKPVAELKIKSVMKVEETAEDDVEEVQPHEPTSEEKSNPPPPVIEQKESSPPVVVLAPSEDRKLPPLPADSKVEPQPGARGKSQGKVEHQAPGSKVEAKQPPAKVEQTKQPTKSDVQPVESLPSKVDILPSKKDSQSSKVDNQASKLNSQPAKEDNQASKVNSQPSKMDNQASKVNSQPSKLDSQPSKVENQAPKVNSQPSKVENQAPKVNSQPSKVDSKASKANSQPSKVDSQPVKVVESKTIVEKLNESPPAPPVSNKDTKSKKSAAKPAVVEKETVPAVSKPSAGPGAFSFSSMTSLGEVVIHDADKFRSSQKQRSQATAKQPGDDKEELSDPNRRKYSRSQLMELREKPQSSALPASFTNAIDIFSVDAGLKPVSMNFATMTNFNTGGGGGNYAFRGSQSTTYKEKDYPPHIIHSVSLREDVKLKTTENAWKPSQLKKDPVERVIMDAKSLLNKLSPENFDSILKKFTQLQFNDENISKVIDLIIFKAVWEPKFAEVYARFIEGLKKHFTANKSKGDKTPDLPSLLMYKCAVEFEDIVKSDRESKLKLEGLKKIADEKEREEARLNYEEEERLSRKKSVGVMTLIGELFKLRLLHPKILHGCFHQLLKTDNDVENLECLAKLITSTGKSVEELNRGTNDHAKISKDSWIKVMNAVENMVSEKNKDKIPSRIRFMILDVLDLKSRNWVPRMAENKPKTMAQIDKDIENEAMRKNMQIRDDDRNVPMSKIPNKKPQPGGGGQSMPQQQASSQKINVDLEKFKILQNQSVDLELSLRPNLPSFNMFSGASGFKSTSKPNNQTRRNIMPQTMSTPPAPFTQQNSFSVLSLSDTSAPPASKPKPPPVSNASRTPQKSKPSPSPAAPSNSFTKPTAPVAAKDNSAFEKTLADCKDKLDNYDIEDKYREFLTFGAHFSDKHDFATSDNQYREEVNILMARCLNHLNEPLLSFHRLEKMYVGFVDKIEKEVNSLGKEKFDARGLTRSLLIDLLEKRSSEHVFVSALLVSLIERHKKCGSCIDLVRDFQIYVTKTDIAEDYPNIFKVVGQIIGYLICFGALTLADYKKVLLIKYVEDVSSKVFVQIVRCICRLRGPGMLFASIPSEESLKECVSPFLYRKYSSARDFEPVDFSAKCLDRYQLQWLVEKSATAENPCRVDAASDELALVNMCLQYFISHRTPEDSSPREYLSANFALSKPGVAGDVRFAVMQKICYESLEPSASASGGDDGDVSYRLNEAKFRGLVSSCVVSTLAASSSLASEVVPSLYAILDVNLHLQLPAGLLLSQFVVVKELLVASSLGGGEPSKVNAPFKTFAEDKALYHSPVCPLARILSKELVVQEAGFSKTSALPSLKNFYNQIEDEEDGEESEEEGEK